MYIDAFRFAAVTNTVISGNTYQEKNSKPGLNHKDFIQFWTNAGNNEGPSKNVNITDNKFYADDGSTHGIFANSPDMTRGAFQDFYIANNYFRSSHTHGITVADALDLEIRNNTLIQDGKYPPLINVTPNSINVKIIGNTAPSVPDRGNGTWEVYGNKETGRGTHWTGGMSGSPISNSGSTSGAAAEDGAGGNTGSSGSDTLVGTSGGDTLRGLGGGDVLKGAGGSDILIGGAGSDRFDFDRLSDSGSARDVIRAGDGASAFQGAGGAAGDRIDVSGIDANVGAGGNQASHFGGTGRGDLSVVESNGDTLVRANVDGDRGFEFALLIDDGAVRASAYSAADFIL
jgi:Ca2+-binding RTX toxin-like protein